MDHAAEIEFYIRERALIARFAAFFLKGRKVALVIGRTIYLHGAKAEELVESKAWLRHELMHVLQYKREGVWLFLIQYAWESICKGYTNNRYEEEARAVEPHKDFEKKFKAVSRRKIDR